VLWRHNSYCSATTFEEGGVLGISGRYAPAAPIPSHTTTPFNTPPYKTGRFRADQQYKDVLNMSIWHLNELFGVIEKDLRFNPMRFVRLCDQSY